MNKTTIQIFSLLFVMTSFCSNAQDVINNGVIHVSDNTILTFKGNFHNTATGDFRATGDVYFEGDMRNQHLYFSEAPGTTYFTGTTTQNIYDDYATQPIKVYIFDNLEINNTGGTGLKVDNNIGLAVQEKLTMRSGDIRLVDDAQLVQTSVTDANVHISGSLLRDRWGTRSTYAYNYYGSPVHNQVGVSYTLNEILYDGTDSGKNPFTPQRVSFVSTSDYNGLPSGVSGGDVTVPLSIEKRWLGAYYRGSGAVSEWKSVSPADGVPVALGFIMKGTGTPEQTQNYVFKGVPNNGDHQFNATTGENFLIANPYPSAMDSRTFILDNPGINEIQFWVDGGTQDHHQSSYYGGMAIRNVVAGVAPSIIPGYGSGLGGAVGVKPGRYIAVGQGFITEIVADGQVVLNNNQRAFQTEASGDPVFHKSEAADFDEDEISIIYFGHEDPEGFHRQLALAFVPNNPDVDEGYNPGYDTEMILPREDEAFFIIENDLTKKYVIQSVGNYDENIKLPIGINIGETGQHSIELDGLENFDQDIYIHDKVEDTYLHLSTTKYYYTLPKGDYLDRFEIVFVDETASIDESKLLDMQVFVNSSDELVISTAPEIIVESVQVYNAVGQQIMATDNVEINIPFAYSNGVYIVKVQTNQGLRTHKIYKK